MNFTKIFNYPVYEVGGCVRDSLLGLPIKDVDIASKLPPIDFKKLCNKLGYRTHDTGIEHGTITVIIKGVPYEHTTFRKDVSCDGRNATIEYSETIEEDLSRRDFTINAIARLDGELIDPFDGQKDLENKILRTVGSAKERFQEDYLRIVRAARFISRLGFKADKALIQAANEFASQIMTHVSIERISDEIKKAKAHGKKFFQVAKDLGFLKEVFSEVNLKPKEFAQWLENIELAQDKNDLLYFAAILIPLYMDKAEQKAAAMRMSSHISKGIGTLFKFRDSLKKDTSPSDLRDIILMSKDYYEDLKVFFSEVFYKSTESSNIITQIESIEEQVFSSIKKPYVTGGFLIKNGLKPSPLFKEIIDESGKMQAEGISEQEVKEAVLKKISSK